MKLNWNFLEEGVGECKTKTFLGGGGGGGGYFLELHHAICQ